MQKYRDPPRQLYEYLSVAKRQGFAWSVAWPWALQRVKWPHAKPVRLAYKQAVAETEWGWRRCYLDEGDIPGAATLAALAELLVGEERHEPHHARRAPTINGHAMRGEAHRTEAA